MHLAENMKVLGRREASLKSETRMPVIRITEGKTGVGSLAQRHLEQGGFEVSTVSMGTDVIQRVTKLHPSLIIIETTTSGGRALEMCRSIRKTPALARTPMILLAANASEEERVLGLESGADDYITESSSGPEIVARVRAVVRRFARQVVRSGEPHLSAPFLHFLTGMPGFAIRTGDVVIDTTAMTISVRGSEIVTTNLEFRLLYYLVHNPARVFTRNQLLDAVWGEQDVESRSVDACVRRLRRKIEPDPMRPTYLKTVRGAGYCLQLDSAA
jgi:DNA-binding response OmpR family regulator